MSMVDNKSCIAGTDGGTVYLTGAGPPLWWTMYGKKARAAQAAAMRLKVSRMGNLRVVLVGKGVFLAPVCNILQHSMIQ